MSSLPISDTSEKIEGAASSRPDVGTNAADAVHLAAQAARAGTPGRFDELRGRLTPGTDSGGGSRRARSPDTVASDALSPAWRRFFGISGVDGWRELPSRRASVQRKVLEDGATYNLHAPSGSDARAWPLELLPLLIDADEWAQIERGVAQRARLLEATLQDIYGPQRLLREGLLPASLIHGHPQYLRPMHGALPAGSIGLHLIALDLARGPEGGWWVVGHRAQSPSGLGYLLENRLIISQQFPEAFRDLKTQRLAATFRALVEGLMRASGAGAEARLALLTPGRHNETYFEHVFLARYLGLTLVEGSDLTVRDQRVYLKTLNGLERVHVLLRRIDDEWLDPLELRADSALGVPGLLQAVRAGGVVLANLPGAGVLESPGLTAFWPGVARCLLGESLHLPASTSWWCGEASVWDAHRTRLRDFVVVPTFPGGEVTSHFDPVVCAQLSDEGLENWRGRIDADPAAHTLMAPVRPSEIPVWHGGRMQPRPMVVRVFALRGSDGQWRVLPGGLTRIARQPERRGVDDDVYLSMQSGSASTSADTWVLTRGEVDASSLLPRPLIASELERAHWVITSRSAENLFWLGRYTERAENTIRLARLMLEALAGAGAPVMAVLRGLLAANGVIDAEVPQPLSPHGVRVFERALLSALVDTRQGTGIAYNLRALRLCASALRERLSPEHWALIEDLDSRFTREMERLQGQVGRETVAGLLAVLGRASTRLSAITGAQSDRMTRDDGWRLLSVGRQIERLDTLSQALAAGFAAGLERSDEGFSMLLAVFDSTITYRARFQARREVMPLLHLLVLDADNPRSLAWVARTMSERLRKLARQDQTWAERVCAPLPVPGAWRLEELCETDADGRHRRLETLLEACGAAALTLSSEIGRHLFSHVQVADRTVWQ